MKWLVGAACMAAVQALATSSAHAQQQADAKAALYAFVSAKPGEDEKVAKVCRVANKNPDIFADGLAARIVSACILAGISIYYN
ncbi:hypothetical protein LB579_30180 [Mesorhizobium sp. BR1-1-7]|uniref:hypothetical protein n=1 Tax=Mesorhizobium sp. BR1-1-7 TaxID=2876647 RepID=UPI001CCE80E4|nr:hypothetical protein [Mesorhizobium sp. BR1-1-7]MBZ9921961.1 hypothetical protein [Mesorhizobium sp. BR1-1-7]